MEVSRNGILFIARREALVLTAYQDGPHKSIGFGHNDPNLQEGDTITVKDSFVKLKEDVRIRAEKLSLLIKQPVTQSEFDALMSLHYQSGNRYAPAIITLINHKEYVVAANVFPLCGRKKNVVYLNKQSF